MSNRTAILKRLMVATTVMTMTFGGSMTALAAEDSYWDTAEVSIDEAAAAEDEKKMLGNPEEGKTESETAIYEEYEVVTYYHYAEEVAEEIEVGEEFSDPDSQKIASEYADDIEEGEYPLRPITEGEAHITITDDSLAQDDVLQGRTEVTSWPRSFNIPLEEDEQSAYANYYTVTLNTTNTEAIADGIIEAAVTVPVAKRCDDPANAVAYADFSSGRFEPDDKISLTYNAENGTWTVHLVLTNMQIKYGNDDGEKPVTYYNFGTIYMIKYDAVKKEVVVEPVQPGVEPSSNENETILAVVDASGVESSTEVESSSEVSTVAPVNDYYQFNLNAAKAIREAAYGSTVEIDAGEYVSFADFVIEEIDKRPDLTINVSYIDAANLHTREQIVIPARAVESDGTVLGESRIEEPETQYYGFRYVDSKINA